jgi:hypothetical protein
MADLSRRERRELEDILGMRTGYVLDFSNRTFDDFVFDSTGRAIYDARYESGSGSKANRLRAFWTIEPNHLVAKLLADLLDHCVRQGADESTGSPVATCRQMVARLSGGSTVADLDVIAPNADGPEFDMLARAVRESIEKHEPEAGLDRLHAFLTKFLRVLCETRGISPQRDKPLHSVVGEYIKALRAKELIHSDMTERILKSTISTFEAFNTVRNDQSLAHPNKLLTYEEALFIFNHVTSAVRFLREVEAAAARAEREDSSSDSYDLPF